MQHTEIGESIKLLAKIVWWAESSTEIKRLDFNLVAASERPRYEAALEAVTKAIQEGKITRDEFLKQVGIS